MRAITLATVAFGLALATGTAAQEAHPDHTLSPLAFLLGRWQGQGEVSDAGAKASGVSSITLEANGGVILRKDHTDLYGKDGKRNGGFDQIMMIYADGSDVRAEYSDGQHLIHYTAPVVEAGKAVEFVSKEAPGAPIFHLRYEALALDRLKVSFGMVPPGQTTLQPIAVGELRRTQ